MIRAARMIGTALLLAAVPQVAIPAAPAAAPARADWTRTFGVTESGGFRVGNPGARVAIVEYASLVCPHCRHFAQASAKPLFGNYIRSGRVSYEFRPLMLNGLDVAATLIARCGGPSRFFPIAEDLYATQPKWSASISEDQAEKLVNLPQSDMLVAFARLAGLTQVGARHGIAPARAEACVRNNAAAENLAKMVRAANDRGIAATPTFFVNGKRVNAYDWATLEPLLKPSGGA